MHLPAYPYSWSRQHHLRPRDLKDEAESRSSTIGPLSRLPHPCALRFETKMAVYLTLGAALAGGMVAVGYVTKLDHSATPFERRSNTHLVDA